MNSNILNYIITVVDEKSFTNAAKKLYISQPSLSQIIKREEKKLGIVIFDRNQNPISVTDAGQEYVLWARQILSLYKKMGNRLRDFSTNEASFLQIGILPEFSAFILSEPLRHFREKNPKTFIKIHELNSNDLLEKLEDSKIDFIIGLTHPDTNNFYSEPLYDEDIVLAGTEKFIPFHKDRESIDLANYSDAPFVIMSQGQFLYNVTHTLCKKSGFVPNSVVQCDNLETAIHIIKAEIGIALLPDLICDVVGGLNYYHLEGQKQRSQISIVYERDNYLVREAKELIELIKENINYEIKK